MTQKGDLLNIVLFFTVSVNVELPIATIKRLAFSLALLLTSLDVLEQKSTAQLRDGNVTCVARFPFALAVVRFAIFLNDDIRIVARRVGSAVVADDLTSENGRQKAKDLVDGLLLTRMPLTALNGFLPQSMVAGLQVFEVRRNGGLMLANGGEVGEQARQIECRLGLTAVTP